MKFNKFVRTNITEMAIYQDGMDLTGVSVAIGYSPKAGDMIDRNPSNHDDMRLVSYEYFKDNFEGV